MFSKYECMYECIDMVKVFIMKKEIDSVDETATKRRRERCLELAGMFKEIGKGSIKLAEKILAKFRLQEGVTKNKAYAYFEDLIEADLIKVSKGEKRWVYNSEEESDLFKVEI